MKLLSAYIENFGRLRDVSVDFSAGLNQLVAENGSGKTTFMAFLHAMLYGMPAGTKLNPQENRRRHYAPWQGGRYGGSLTFAANGRRYTVSRIFGEKESQDSFSLYDADTELPSEDFPPTLGDALFGVDGDSFEKSASVPSFEKDRFAAKGSQIAERLSSYVEETDGAISYEKAFDILEKQRKVYIKTGNKGLLPETEAEIERVRLHLLEAERDKETADSLDKSIALLEKERTRLLAEEEALSALLYEEGKKESELALRRHGEALYARLSELDRTLSEALLAFRGRLPAEDELYAAEKEAYLLSNGSAAWQSPEEKAELCELARLFGGQVPEDAALQKMASAEKAESAAASARSGVPPRAWFFLFAGILFGICGAICSFVFPVLDFLFFPLCILAFIPFYKITVSEKAKKTAVPDDSRYLELLSLRERYRVLLKAHAESEKTAAEAEEKKQFLIAFAASFGEETGEPSARIASLRRRTEAYKRCLSEREQANAMYRAFLAENGALLNNTVVLTAAPSESAEEKRRCLRERLSRVEEEIKAESRRVLPIREHAGKSEEYRLQIASLTERAKDYRRHATAIERAEKLLTAARDALSLRYLSDMQASFDRYAARFLPDLNDTASLSGDLALKMKNGAQRVSPLYYSDGVQDVLSFCMHVSLADALFKEELPPLFFDDSFATWDDTRMESGLRFLRERAEGQQVFYFTCQEARADKTAKNLSLD